MPENGRAVFIIDPEKYMQKESDQAWAIVVKQLPEKIKFVFAQRPGDVLVDSETFDALDNVVRVPRERLGILEEEAVDELLTQRIKGTKYTVTEIREVLSRYEGHPYALGAALDLIEGGIELEELPEKPEPIEFAEVQWRKVSKISEDAIRLFKGYAILEVGVPDDVVQAVSEIDSNKRQHLVADKSLRGLLREEGEGLRIYHAILADYILSQLTEEEEWEYHGRAIEFYRNTLWVAEEEQTKPDALAAIRLAEHVLATRGSTQFVCAFVNACFKPLLRLGLWEAGVNFAQRALKLVEKGSKQEVMIKGNLGPLLSELGHLDEAEQMISEALEASERFGDKEGTAAGYGNLGITYRVRGELDKAIEMFEKSLEISQHSGMLELTASQLRNLGVVYGIRKNLKKAEGLLRKSLSIEKRLHRLEGIGTCYGNLGIIYMDGGELDKAEEMQKKSLEIDRKLGRLVGMANSYGNLGLIYQMRGDLDKAEQMYNKVLKIEEKLGRPDSIANAHSNLGGIYKERGDNAKAREYWEKAVDLYKRIGMPHKVEEVESWLSKLSQKGKGKREKRQMS
jgi:tetratricopeptide (TPR) repeat protein